MKIKYLPSQDSRVQYFNQFIETAFPHFITEETPDVLLVAGGDGALHHAIYQNSSFEGVFFGKAMGTLNFLMNTLENDFVQLKAIEDNSLSLAISKTETIAVYKNGNYIGEAANDILLGDSVNGYHTYLINTEDKFFQEFKVKGTGLCISTPLGSTAYNLNNGGSILPLESNLWSITGIACNRFIKDILPSQGISIKATSGNLFISGIDKGQVGIDDLLEFRAGKSIKLGFLNPASLSLRRAEFSHRFRKEN